MEMYLRNPLTGEKKKARTGFSWTTFFFLFFVPLIRGDWKWAIVMFLLQFTVGIATFGIGSFVMAIVFGIKYNEMHLNGLREKGYLEISQGEYFGVSAPATHPA
jgi:hypothetical protein